MGWQKSERVGWLIQHETASRGIRSLLSHSVNMINSVWSTKSLFSRKITSFCPRQYWITSTKNTVLRSASSLSSTKFFWCEAPWVQTSPDFLKVLNLEIFYKWFCLMYNQRTKISNCLNNCCFLNSKNIWFLLLLLLRQCQQSTINTEQNKILFPKQIMCGIWNRGDNNQSQWWKLA